MFSTRFKILSVILVVIIAVLIIFIYYRATAPVKFASYNQILNAELNSISSQKGNLTFYYKGNFTTNQPLSNSLIKIPFSIPFNYTFYREGDIGLTSINVYYNMERLFALQDLMSNYTVVNTLKEYINNGTKATYNLSKLNSLLGKYNQSAPLAKIAFTNASGLYICSAYPGLNRNATLGIFSCGLVSNSTVEGLKYIVYNLSQIAVHAIGFDMNKLNMTVHYLKTSSFLNQTCAEYSLSSIVKSYLISTIYLNSSAYVNGTECISDKFILPLYQYINITIPSKGVYASLNLTLGNISNFIPDTIGKFPSNYALNLSYGSIS